MTLKVMLRWRLHIYKNFTSFLAAWWCYHHAMPLWVLHIQRPTISYIYGCESTSHTNVSGWQNPHPESMLQGSSDANSTTIHYYGSESRRWTLTQEETTTTVKRHCSLMLTDMYTWELLSWSPNVLSWSPKDTCENMLMILVTSWSFIDNSSHLLTWIFIIVTLIVTCIYPDQ